MKSPPVGPPGGCCRIGPAHIAKLRRHLKGSCGSPSSDWRKERFHFQALVENLILLENKWSATSDTMVCVCASGADISCTRIWKGTMQLWFHSLTDGDSTLGLYTFKYKGRLHDVTLGFKLPQHWRLTPLSLNVGRKPRPFSVLVIQIYSRIPDSISLLRYTHTAGRCINQKREMWFCFMGWNHESCRENYSHIKQDSWRVATHFTI